MVATARPVGAGGRTVRTRATAIARTAEVAFAGRSVWSTSSFGTATFAAAATESLAHRFAHLLALFFAELAVAVLVELLCHALVHLFPRGSPLVVAELAITILVKILEHSLTHFLATGPVAGRAAIIWRLSECGQTHEACRH
jgi:hypothetical protein